VGWRKFLLVVPTLAIGLSVLQSPMEAHAGPPTPHCSEGSILNGTCVSGNVNGGGVTLTGHKKNGGSNGSKSGSKKPKPPKHQCTLVPEACNIFGVIPPGGPGNPAVTISDVKNFGVTAGTDHMEPNGWMIVGLATNFYSVGGVEVRNGTLLGEPASVRFTPIAWHWTYGDGKSATRTTKGATWAAQRIPDFNPTPTSHVYSREGTYFIDLSITFRAEYRFAGGAWTPVIGTITLPSNRLEATAGDAKTVLVNHDCNQNPGGPGC
jgi:hypothetical protein